jgi:hypothetical protein
VALLSPQQIPNSTSLTPTYSTVGATDTVVPDDRSFLVWRNTNASVNNVTVVVPGADYGQARPDVSFVVPATTGEKWYGPLVPDLADPTTGLISITNSNTGAGSTVALVRV